MNKKLFKRDERIWELKTMGMSYREIGKIVGLSSPSSVFKAYQRTKKRLKNKLISLSTGTKENA